MKMFELPVSDCGCFVAGELDASIFQTDPDEPPKPKCGVVIWYESHEACKAALQAAMRAHWPDDASLDLGVASG